MLTPEKMSRKKEYIFNVTPYHSLQEALAIKQQHSNQNELHVFGTSAVAAAVNERYNLSTISIDEITNKLFPDFRTVKTEIYLQSILRKEVIQGNYINKKYLLNHLSEVVRTFSIFSELNTTKISFLTSDSKQNEIIQLINHLLEQDILSKYHKTQESLTMQEISLKLCGHKELKMISIYEIDYLNYLRMNIIHWLRSKGFQVEMYIPYNKEYPNTFTFWKDVYGVVTNMNLDVIHNDLGNNSGSMNGKKFGEFNENNLSEQLKDLAKIEVVEFNSPGDFGKYYDQTNDNIMAVKPKEINQLVQNKKSSMFENNIGKFIYYLKYCRYENDNFHLNYDILIELITTDIIYTSAHKGADALGLLVDLREYMYGVKTIRDIQERLKRLQELNLISHTFDKENLEDTDRHILKRYMLNPFKAFNYTHHERYLITINQLIELVEVLERRLKYLLIEDNDVCYVNDYFDRWKTIISDLPELEGKQQWLELFDESVPEEWQFYIEELLALIYYLASTISTEGKKVYDISRIQEAILQKEQSQTLHITNMTQFNFPEEHQTTLTKLFTYTEIKQIINNSVEGQHKSTLLHSLWVDYSVVEKFSYLGPFQIYNVLANYTGPIVFSLIKHLNENDMRSVYLDILDDLYTGTEILEYQPYRDMVYQHNYERDNNHKKITIDVNMFKSKIPELYWLDHDFCSKKFFLTTFVEKQPIYNSDFHHQFIFGKIGKLLSSSHHERQSFRELIYPLFPHWTYAKKDNLIDLEYKISMMDYKGFENISYPRELKGFQILRSVYRQNRRSKAKNQYKNNHSNNEADLTKTYLNNIRSNKVIAEPGSHCMMCPFLYSCNEGMYSIDNFKY